VVVRPLQQGLQLLFSVAGGPISGETATMLKQPRQRTWDEVLSELRRLQFDVQDVPGDANQRRIGKYGCAIVLEKVQNEAGLRAAVRPGW